MIHYVKPTDTVLSQFACGEWPMERMKQRITIHKRSVTCAKCRKLLGLPKKKRHSAAGGEGSK